MSAEYPLQIGALEYHTVPESWIRVGADENDDPGPQLLAVSVAKFRGSLKVRYAHPWNGRERVGVMIYPMSDAGSRPRREEWARSVAASKLDPVGVLRSAEREHLREIWDGLAENVIDWRPPDGTLLADGGQTERLPWCENCDCFAVPDDDGNCGECGESVVLADGGRLASEPPSCFFCGSDYRVKETRDAEGYAFHTVVYTCSDPTCPGFLARREDIPEQSGLGEFESAEEGQT